MTNSTLELIAVLISDAQERLQSPIERKEHCSLIRDIFIAWLDYDPEYLEPEDHTLFMQFGTTIIEMAKEYFETYGIKYDLSNNLNLIQ